MHMIRNVNGHVKRQGLIPDILTGVLGTGLPTPTLSLPSQLPTIIPIPKPSNSATSLTPSDLSTSGTSTSTSSESSASSSSSSSTTSSTESTTETPTPTTPTPTPLVYETTSGGQVHTVTTIVDAAPSATNNLTASPAPKSFLQNKVLSGVVFTLISIIGLAILLSILAFVLRRRRNNRLMKDAISFDPSSTIDSDHYYGAEKVRQSTARQSFSPRSSNEHGYGSSHGAAGAGQRVGSAFAANNPQFEHAAPQPPLRALGPYDSGRANGGGLPNVTNPEPINWGPSLTPFTAPLPMAFGQQDIQHEALADGRAQSQNRILKVANE
ncbi:hypothetical protein Hypma_010349 [Hypsizygus marmoreus]|uniref:Mid2 domain-containing protein n=1 Tax=Hypsizygus marmoreus TaxID=39966 RepID=A0A369JKY9_HYPMA|nr:hypothetical protein Hypma_010349 [Hypsizygus marmoreus]